MQCMRLFNAYSGEPSKNEPNLVRSCHFAPLVLVVFKKKHNQRAIKYGCNHVVCHGVV